ncbi:unnamed protein product, partial [marine sediment metagenome]
MMTEKIIIGLAPKDKKDEVKKNIEKIKEEMLEMLPDEIDKEIRIRYKIKEGEDISDKIRKKFLEKDIGDIAAASIGASKMKTADVAKIS